jgi:hypothetical protein
MKYKPNYLVSLVLSVFTLVVVICPSAQATYIATLDQVGADVVAMGSGSLDTTALSFQPGGFSGQGAVHGSNGLFLLGPATNQNFSGFLGISGPTSYGSGMTVFANSGGGNIAGVNGTGSFLFVPTGYMSGTQLGVSTDTWNNATLASLGVTPGTYVWNWGSGMNADSFTLQIGPTNGVPESGSTFALLLGAVGTLIALRSPSSRKANQRFVRWRTS